MNRVEPQQKPQSDSKFRYYVALALILVLAFARSARADYYPITIPTNTYNASVVVPKSAAPLIFNNYTTATLDGGTNNTGDTIFEYGYAAGESNVYDGLQFGLAPYLTDDLGIPPAGSTFSAQDGSGHLWELPESYATNDTVLVYSAIPTVTITISSNAGPWQKLSFLTTGEGGANSVGVLVTHQGGTIDSTVFTNNDWNSQTTSTNPVARYLHAKVNMGTDLEGSVGHIDNITLLNSNAVGAKLYYADVALGDTTDPITSITVTNGSANHAAIYAISGFDGTSWYPIGISGFNKDTIVEATATHPGSMLQYTTVTLDQGTNNWQNALYEKGFNQNAPNTGLPVHGSVLTFGSAQFLMPPDYTTDCALYIGNQGPTKGTLTFSNPVAAVGLSFLGTAGNGPVSMSYTVTHTTGPVESGSISIGDWFTAGTGTNPGLGGRFEPDVISFQNITASAPANTAPMLHTNTITLTDTNDPVVSVSFANTTATTGGRAVILAVSTTVNGSAFTPAGVSGWNEDPIVEASATWQYQTNGTPGPLTLLTNHLTTVTLDQSYTIASNAFYEQGTYLAFPNSGLPAAGSTISSFSLPDHHYTLAPSWEQNNVIYLDRTNITSATIPFPQPYVTYAALSFLTAGANGGVTNQVILQHLNGVTETNYIVSRDWVGNTPYAYDTVGRLDLLTGFANDAAEGAPGNPRLYDAQFILQDLYSPVTNAIINYYQAVNNSSARSVIFAVSGYQGDVPPTIGGISASAFAGYAGTNTTLSGSVTGGSTNGLALQWIYSPDDTNWVAVTEGTNATLGGTFSGSTSGTLSLSNLIWSDSGYYAFVAYNDIGSVTSAPALVTIVSPLPNMFHPGDPITAYQPNCGGSPATETVDHAIDNLVGNDPGKYLNYGEYDDGLQEFAGPVGFITTPSIGATIVNVVRLFTANDTVGRDPADVEVDGSNDGGNTWTVILPDHPLALPATRNVGTSTAANPLTQALQEVYFENTSAYTTYRVFFNNVKTDTQVNSMQIGEVQLLGGQLQVPPTIVAQSGANLTVFSGTSPTLFATATGFPSNFTYQWYLNGSTAIPGATAATLVLSNVTAALTGNQYDVVVSNADGSATSSPVTLTVVTAPTGDYATTILADKPYAYYRLDEPDDGSQVNTGDTGYDYVGGHNGVYTNVTLGVPGYNPADSDTALQVGENGNYGSPSLLGNININFGVPTNQNGAFSVEAWVNGYSGLPETNGAGIVAKGYGGGGEQFDLDTGAAGGGGYRFLIRDASGAGHTANSAITNDTSDGLWHHLVGVVDQANGKLLLYVDGELEGSATLAPGAGILNSAATANFPVTIGSRSVGQNGPFSEQFIGDIDEVALYNYALSSNQVVSHYNAAQVPPTIVVAPTNTSAPEGGLAIISSVIIGTPPLQIQWLQSTDGGGSYAPVLGGTNQTLVISNVPASDNGYVYEVTVANAYGSQTSGPVSLTIVSGPPVLEADLATNYVVYPGNEVTLSAQFSGTLPIGYTWTHNGTPITDGGHYSGASSNVLLISDAVGENGGTYQLTATNAYGSASSSVATLTVLPSVIGFNGGTNWNSESVDFFSSSFPSANTLELTDGDTSEEQAQWFKTPVYIGGFDASFDYYEDYGTSGADGAAFVIQNAGPTALGTAGGGIGYQGITPSVGLAYNIYSANDYGGFGVQFLEDGNLDNTFTTGGISPANGNPIHTEFHYFNGVVTVTFTDTVLGGTFKTNVDIDLPSVLGAETAYIGFTGASGGIGAYQTVSNFKYTPILGLTTSVVGGQLVLTWPVGSGSYVLQQSSTVAGGGWTESTATVTQVGGVNQVSVPLTEAAQFYRLTLPAGQ